MADALLEQVVEQLNNLNVSQPLAVAVSGGGDSVALYRLLLTQFSVEKIHVLHFNHNLRAEAEDDENFVRALAQTHGSPCHAAIWHKEPTGNIQQAAREARYAFFQKICAEHGITQLCVGHTQDDVLETFLMRLARGSGLTGLASIQAQVKRGELTIVRPLLGVNRLDLRGYLEDIQQTWREDATNEDTNYQRIKMRQLLPKLAAQGLSPEHLAASIKSLQRAEGGLAEVTQDLFDSYWQNGAFPCAMLFRQPLEIQIRLLGLMVRDFHPAAMLPRTSKRESALIKLQNAEKMTLGGVIFTVEDGLIYTVSEIKR